MTEDDLKRITKEAQKEALKEWLDDKYITFGKWSVGTVAAAALAALVYFILWANNWHR